MAGDYPHFQQLAAITSETLMTRCAGVLRSISYLSNSRLKVCTISKGCKCRTVYKIDKPALLHGFLPGQWIEITYQQPMLALTVKMQFQQTVNPVNVYMIQCITMSMPQLEPPLENIALVMFFLFSQCIYHRDYYADKTTLSCPR